MDVFPVILNGFIVKMFSKMRAGIAFFLLLSPVSGFAQLALGGPMAGNESICKSNNENIREISVVHYEDVYFYFDRLASGYRVAKGSKNKDNITGTRDVLDNSDGWVKRMSLVQGHPRGRLQVTPTPGATYYDSNLNQIQRFPTTSV